MKNLLFLIIVVLSLNTFSQSKYITRDGTILFEASVPAFEEVKATNNTVTAIINTDNGEFATLILVKGFRFKNALMQEHFNENYAESDTYPKSTFKGTIDSFDVSKLNKQAVIKSISGALTFHGETKTIDNANMSISINNNIISISGKLHVKASDFNIKIPKIITSKIAEDIEISYVFSLKQN